LEHVTPAGIAEPQGPLGAPHWKAVLFWLMLKGTLPAVQDEMHSSSASAKEVMPNSSLILESRAGMKAGSRLAAWAAA